MNLSHTPRLLHIAALMVLAALLLASAGFGQLAPVGGSVSGKVVDRQGQAVVGAKVLVVGERRFQGKTDRWGYRFEHLPNDTYSVEASAPGYITSLVEQVDLRLGDSLRIDFRLKPGKPNAVSFTTMPIIDTKTAGAAYRLFDPPIGSLPLAGTLSAIERLLPQESELVSTSSLYIDGGELLPEMALDFAIWRPAVGRLASELFETADLFGSRIDPRVRTLDSLQLLTRGASTLWHGRFGVRVNTDDLAGADQPGLSERFEEVRPYATLLVPVGSRFRLFAGLANHRSTQRPLDLGGLASSDSLRGIRSERKDRSRFFRLNGGPLGPNLELSASLLEIASEEAAFDGGSVSEISGQSEPALFESKITRNMLRLNRFSGRYGVIAQFNDRRASTLLDAFETRRVRTEGQAVSLDTLISRHAMVLGLSREKTTGDLLAEPLSKNASRRLLGDADLELERINLSLSDQWRATRNLAIQVGLRAERLTWSERRGGSLTENDESWLLPRIGVAWDVFGNGEWALLLSGGEELVRQVAIFDLGLEPFLERGLPPTDRVEVEAFSISSRYQIFPGLIVDSEFGRRKFAGDRELTLRPLAEEEQRFRFGAEARIGERWLARGLYELRDIGMVSPGFGQVAQPAELGTTQRTHFHVVRNFERGWVLSGVFEYVDDYNVANRSLGVLTEAPRSVATGPSSLSQLDLMLEYRLGGLPNVPFLGENQPKLTWRIEVLNVTDQQQAPAAIPDVFIGAGTEGLFPHSTLSGEGLSALRPGSVDSDLVAVSQQLGRRIWLGFGLEL